MTIHNNDAVRAGTYVVTGRNENLRRRLLNMEYQGFFLNLIETDPLPACEIDINALTWRGPVTVLPAPAREYINQTLGGRHGTANTMRTVIQNFMTRGGFVTTEGQTYPEIRVYVAGEEAIGNTRIESQLQALLQRLDSERRLTFWIFFHMDDNVQILRNWRAFRVDP